MSALGRADIIHIMIGTPSASSSYPVRISLLPLLVAFALAVTCGAPRAAELQPQSYPWLMSHATLVIAGTVESVSGGLFGAGRTATVSVEGLIKGRWNRRDLE